MRILILGGDGYLGWPTAMRFSDGGHEVHVVDNYLRRRAHEEVGTDTLVPILGSLPERAAAWKEVSGKEIGVTEGDLVEWDLTSRSLPDLPPGSDRALRRACRPPRTRCATATTPSSPSRTTS